jgi:hypothetical protein
MQKILIALVLVLFTATSIHAQALEHKPKQLFISPELSFGTPIILNQNNYGYSELGYELTFGGQAGVMVGWDYFLKQSFKTGILVSKWGQHYNDILADKRVKKNINNYYLQIPATYKHVFGRKRGYDHEVFSPYVFASLRVSYLFYSNVEFFREQENGEMKEEDLVTFVTEGGKNINSDEIIAMGNPSKDKNLFSPIDINLELGGGYQYFITRRISLFAEVHVASSILDINAGEWRFRNNKNNYSGSYNIYGGIKIGANVYLFKNSR